MNFRPCRIVKELTDFKKNIIWTIISACILGCLIPISGYIMARGINGLNSKYEIIRYNDVLKYSITFLLLSFFQGIGNCIMNWKCNSLGMTLARIYRRKLITKYLQFHLSYFDIKSNSPGALVTKLSNDTMNLNQMIMLLLSKSVQCICIIFIGFILGFIYDFRFTLIDFSFVPFIVVANIMKDSLFNGANKRGYKGNA